MAEASKSASGGTRPIKADQMFKTISDVWFAAVKDRLRAFVADPEQWKYEISKPEARALLEHVEDREASR